MPTRPWIGEPPSASTCAEYRLSLLLHSQRRIECALRVVLMRDWRAEQREDPVAGGLHDVAVVAMDCVDHQQQCRIDNRPRFLGVEVRHQLSRSLDVGKQRRDGLAFAVGNLVGFEQWSFVWGRFGQTGRRVCGLRLRRRSGLKRRAAFLAEFCGWWIFEAALRA
jgi:hypothetical protein